MRIAIVDDHPLVWEGIKSILLSEDGFDLVGCAANGREAERLFRESQPDLVLVDLRIPGESGISIISNLRQVLPWAKFAVLSTYAHDDDVEKALDAKVDGYILKEAHPEELISALRLIGRGRTYFDPQVVQAALRFRKITRDTTTRLTPREREVLLALAKGLSNREIAGSLYITEHTVKKHVSAILDKLNLEDRTQAALYAISRKE